MIKWLFNTLRLVSPVVVFLAVLAPSNGFTQVGVVDPQTLCVPMEMHSGAPDEEPCLNELKGVAKRDGHVLTLKLGNGKTRIIHDSKECDDPDHEDLCVSYRLVGYIGDKQFVVAVQPYECGFVWLVDRRTGREIELLGWPILSPNKKRFVVTASSVAGECDPAYAVAVFSLVKDVPQLEWKSAPPADIGDHDYDGWDGNNRVLLRVDVDGKHRSAHLTLTAQGWQLTD